MGIYFRGLDVGMTGQKIWTEIWGKYTQLYSKKISFDNISLFCPQNSLYNFPYC